MSWKEELSKVIEEFERATKAQSSLSAKDVESIRIRFLGKKGLLKPLYSLMKGLPDDEKRQLGRQLNEVKAKIEAFIKNARLSSPSGESIDFDLSLPSEIRPAPGRAHILSQVQNRIVSIFTSMGFALFTGPEIEREYNNFSGLNIDISHPSRDDFDTFYIKTEFPNDELGRYLLRSHTSPMQVRIMKEFAPPLAAIVPGRVYRPDAVDASHSFMFHQVEGFYVDDDVRFGQLKGVLLEFSRRFFEKEVDIRFRPHYFPFTEPSAEVDISCLLCDGAGCSACKQSGWIEVLGCGMIHPNVLNALGKDYQGKKGFAFGMGVERLCMLKYGIPDIRLFYNNEMDFLKQF